MIQKFSQLFSPYFFLDVSITPQLGRKTCYLDKEKKTNRVAIFSNSEDVQGTAVVNLRPGRTLDHNGIRIELVGEIIFSKRNVAPHSFCLMSKDLEPPGILYESKLYNWKFAAVEKPYESYWGESVRVRYFVRLMVVKPYGNSASKEAEFAVQNFSEITIPPQPIKMEVGIEGCLHLEFEYDKSCYHLKDVVCGKVQFLLVRIKVKYMEIDIARSEILKFSGVQQRVFNDVVAKFEIMDGAAVKSEVVPVRFRMSGYNLTPTYENIQNKFSVKYFLNLILVDEEERRYFKRQEITLYRKKED